MGDRQSRKTADGLMAELEQKPEFVERQQRMSADREARRRQYAQAAAGLLEDLSSAGFSVSTLAELRQKGVGNRRAVPILAAWLPRVDYPPLKRDIIATLGSPWAKPDAAAPLVEMFRQEHPDRDPKAGARWELGDALQRVADESVLDDLIAIAQDTRFGSERGLAVAALGNMGRARERVVPVLADLLDDAEVAGYAIVGLGKLRAVEARPLIEPFLNHTEVWVRNEAKMALGQFRK